MAKIKEWIKKQKELLKRYTSGKQRCYMCKKVKLVKEFYTDKTKLRSVTNRCKKCFSLYYKKKYVNKLSLN